MKIDCLKKRKNSFALSLSFLALPFFSSCSTFNSSTLDSKSADSRSDSVIWSNTTSESARVSENLLSERGFLNSGSLLISKNLEELRNKDNLLLSEVLTQNLSTENPLIFGYIPTKDSFLPAINESWIKIDTKRKKLLVYKNKQPLLSIDIAGSSFIEPGKYSVQLKQKNPVWYADDSYFSQRGLKTPGKESDRRFLKGALGDSALYLSPGFAIHNSRLWDLQVGGIQVSKSDFQKMSALTDVGSTVVIE